MDLSQAIVSLPAARSQFEANIAVLKNGRRDTASNRQCVGLTTVPSNGSELARAKILERTGGNRRRPAGVTQHTCELSIPWKRGDTEHTRTALPFRRGRVARAEVSQPEALYQMSL